MRKNKVVQTKHFGVANGLRRSGHVIIHPKVEGQAAKKDIHAPSISLAKHYMRTGNLSK